MGKTKTILAIETSCDETAAAVVRLDGLVMSDVKASQVDIFKSIGGVVPEMAARAHMEMILPVIDEVMKQAEIGWDEIDSIAVTEGPGLIGALLVGLSAARALAWSKGKALALVEHRQAHLMANWLWQEGEERPKIGMPAIGLLVSGGHTELVWMEKQNSFEVIGQTIDDAAGEAFDKVGSLLGLGYPGGPVIARAAKGGDPRAFNFPRSWLEKGSLNFSFSGLKTAVSREVNKLLTEDGDQEERLKLIANLAASFQEAVVEVLVTKTQWAVEKFKPKSVLLAGGVAANLVLRERLLETFGKRLHVPKLEFCTDNAAMVGVAGGISK